MKNLLLVPFIAPLLVFGSIGGCSRSSGANQPSEMQIRELQSFGRELWSQYGERQPPIDVWVGALPWLKFKRMELRPDGAYFIMDESDTEERGYAVVDSVGVFERQHPGPDTVVLDTFVCRYRFTK